MGESMHGADKIMHANHKCTEDQPGKNCSAGKFQIYLKFTSYPRA